VTNVFNSVSRRVIFQKLHAINVDIIQLIPFVRAFYAFEFPLFYNHRNCENNITIILSIMGTHRSDLLKGALFTLTHFKALYSTTNHFPSYIFPSITNDTHIIGPPLIVSSTYHF
jgi:hypothetical protein